MQFFLNGLIAGSTYALVALSFALIYGTTRFFHFAHGAVYTAGAYLAFATATGLKLPLPLAAGLAVGGATLLGMGMERGIYRPLRRREATPLVLLLASLGLYVVFQNAISLLFGDDVKTLRTGEVQQGLPLFGAYITPIQITILLVSLALFVGLSLLLKYTKLGKAVRAVANDPELALVAGIDTDKIILGTFALGSALAGIAAILVALDVDMTPTMGMNALMMGVVAVIIGGVGSMPGAALGGLLLGLAQHLGVWKIPSQWQDAMAFVILLLFLLFRPYGILGRRAKKVQV